MRSRRRRHGRTSPPATTRGSSAWSRASPSWSATSAWPSSSSGAPASASTRGRRSGRSRRSAGPRTSSSTGSASSRRPTSIVNVDENRSENAEALAEFVPHVVVTHPLGAARQPRAVPADRGDLRPRGARPSGCAREFEAAYARAARRDRGPRSDVLYLIWRDPWMTIAPDTYIAQTLALVNWQTHPLSARRPLPGGRPRRFAGRVDRVLLSSEPFHFKEHHVAEVAALSRARGVADRRRDDLLVRQPRDRGPALPRGLRLSGGASPTRSRAA